MVRAQLLERGIEDESVLAAMEKVPRHRFLDPALRSRAYGDHALPIGSGQTISQPYMVALMTACLRLKGGEKILEIGTGSGYQAAILAEFTPRVFTIERHAVLARSAAAVLAELGCGNVITKTGDGSRGWPEHAPYDRIIVTAGAPVVPDSLTDQLSSKGGILVIPVGDRQIQSLVAHERKGSRVSVRTLCDCAFVPLLGLEGWDAP
ncbi:MAG: protein-L-isoaspartate(D-aspartate) O-methyltransferase [Gemmatimonadota bacterium]|nr:protein-L-isoaspartate(D-aspartate) O-methyltransferase [Gemmatimonadota bacterium]